MYLGINRIKKIVIILNSTLILWILVSYSRGFFHEYLILLVSAILYGYLYILHFCREGKKIGKSMDLIIDGEWIPLAVFGLIIAS